MHHSTSTVAALGAGVFTAGAVFGQGQLWLHQFGTPAYDRASALVPDSAGGFFAAGSNVLDPWLARYDADGQRLWHRADLGSPEHDSAAALAPDLHGGVYIVGSTSGQIGAPNPYTTKQSWLARHDSDGNRLWARQMGGLSSSGANAAAPDGHGGVFVAGYIDYDWGCSTSMGWSAWLAHYDEHGNRSWIRPYGTDRYTVATALATDGDGGTYLAGWSGQITYDHRTAWLARFDGDGHLLWSRHFTSSRDIDAAALTPDGDGGVYIGGTTDGDMLLPVSGPTDAWFARYDASGTQIWIRQFGLYAGEVLLALAADPRGGVLVAGRTTGIVTQPYGGASDAWFGHFDDLGRRTWIAQLGTTVADYAHAIIPDSAAGAIVAGLTAGELGGPSQGADDAWIGRFSSPWTCYPNCDQSTTAPALNVDDVTCFFYQFAMARAQPHENQLGHYVNCDGSTTPPVINVDDFVCFINTFAAGCP